MAAKSDSDSSSSSSSSSSDEEESLADRGTNEANTTNDEKADAITIEEEVDNDNGENVDVHDEDNVDGHDDDANYNDTSNTADDSCKIFISRIPQIFTEEVITRILEEKFGEGCVIEASIASEKEEDDKYARPRDTFEDDKKSGKDADAKHRGFGFVTFSTQSQFEAAIEAGTVRGSIKPSSKRKHTLYIRPVVRDDEYADGAAEISNGNKNLCFLWKKNRCPYGDGCKFVHEGDGGCVTKDGDASKKKQKCFAFKKSGKCKLGDECPYSHDIVVNKTENKADVCKEVGNKKEKSERDCINWKNKGKCRKGDKCPFRHDDSVRDKVLAKKKGKEEENDDTKRKREDKVRQSLSIRVFGLNYDTTQDDIRKFFEHCGPIMEITFPLFEDSGRSKGYCGVLFQSPKAVEKAVELDGSELHGRWLRIQEGKMYLKKWEEVENVRKGALDDARMEEEEALVGEYGQKVKKRKKHGFKD